MAYRAHDSRRKFGVESGAFTGDRVVDLTKLPPGAREALRERILSGNPSPILSSTRTIDRFLSVVLFLLGVVTTIAVIGAGFGGLRTITQLETWWIVLYGTLGAASFYGLGRFVRSALRDGLARFPQGTLVFPLDLLTFDGQRMRVRSFGDARYLEAKDDTLEIEYANGDKVRVRGQRRAKASLFAEMLAAQHDLEDASVAGSSAKDVLAELRAHYTWKELAPPAEANPQRLGIVVAFTILGAVLGGLTWRIRAPLEDDALFESALAADRIYAYEAYLAIGTRHRQAAIDDEADVSRRLIKGEPRLLAELIAQHPGTTAAKRAERDLRDACVDYAKRSSRDRCKPPTGPGPAECVPLEEETICAPEIRTADVAHVAGSNDLRAIFEERVRAVHEGRSEVVDLMDGRIDTLIEEENAKLCAVGVIADDLRALHEVARKEKHPATLIVVIHDLEPRPNEPRADRLWSLLAQTRDAAVDLRRVGEAPDRVWDFEVSSKSLEMISGASFGDRARVVRVPTVVIPSTEELTVPFGWEQVGALESLGFRLQGNPPSRCTLPHDFLPRKRVHICTLGASQF